MPAEGTEAALTHSAIFQLYYPLAASWLFMAIESPVAIAIISRLPEGQLNTAAFFMMMALSLWIESPVIDLLSTSTTLSKNYRDYLVLRRFVLMLIGFVTAVHFLVAWTPLYWFISENVLRVPHEVADAARPGFMLMVPWSGFIGWRRYLQGILIRFAQTKRVGYGTIVRMTTMAGTGIALFFFSGLPSIMIAAIALVASVFAEAMYVHFATAPVIKQKLEIENPTSDTPELSFRKLFTFHLPLTATTSVMMLGGPIVLAALAKAPQSVLQIAGWQVAQSLLWLHRTIVFALPEVVITLYRDAQSAQKLRSFCVSVGLFTSGLMLVTGLTRLDVWIFTSLLDARPDTAAVAHIAFLAASMTPLLGALQSYVRGMLTAHHLNVARFAAVMVSIGVLAGLLLLSVVLGVAGVLAAAIALTLTLIAELAVLVFSWRRRSADAPA